MAWSQTAELKLVDHEENGRRTALIRDWGDVFLELGDKQSLLASLKESQFFKAFEDQGIAYEVFEKAYDCTSRRRFMGAKLLISICKRVVFPTDCRGHFNQFRVVGEDSRPSSRHL